VKAVLRLAGALLLVALVAGPAFGQVTSQDIAEAEAELIDLRAETDRLAVQYDGALARSAQLENQIAGLEAATQDSQIQLGDTRQLVRERAVEMYIESSTAQISLLFVEDDGGIDVALGYLEQLGTSDTKLLRDLATIETEYERQLAELETARSEQETVVADLSVVAAELSARLETAQNTYVALVEQRAAEERARLEEEARLRAIEEARLAAEAAARAVATSTTVAPTTTGAGGTTNTVAGETTTTTAPPPPPPAGGRACPVNGFTSFTDTWGAPRSGGRSHQGVDMLGARWTPLVALEGGTIRRLGNGGLGGITIYLKGASGDEYYYAHLEAWADGLRVGQGVQAGELIGYLGSSGNASYSLPHLHFELHPGGGRAVNAYPLVKGLCG
jgi:murein DD-endopeptidase MepM/ murein hydrolase activator NlpD